MASISCQTKPSILCATVNALTQELAHSQCLSTPGAGSLPKVLTEHAKKAASKEGSCSKRCVCVSIQYFPAPNLTVVLAGQRQDSPLLAQKSQSELPCEATPTRFLGSKRSICIHWQPRHNSNCSSSLGAQPTSESSFPE